MMNNFLNLLKITMLLTLFLFSACETISLEELEEETANEQKVNDVVFKFRTTKDVEIVYPLHVYVLDYATDKIVHNKTILEEQESFSLNLKNGNYYIAAIAGADDCDFSNLTDSNGRILIPASGVLTKPVQMGGADVKVTTDVTLQIMMYHMVSALSITLSDLPEDVTSINVNLSPLASEIDITGTMWNPIVCEIPLKKENDVWKSGLIYTLPSTSNNLTFSILTQTPTGQSAYGYKYDGGLVKNTPYEFIGSFDKGFTVQGEIALQGWNNLQTINFTFGANNSIVENDPEPDDSSNDSSQTSQEEFEEIEVTSLPNIGDICEGYIIACVGEETSNSKEVLLLSVEDWSEINSKISETDPEMAQRICNEYTENEITNWHIPTANEATELIQNLGMSNLSTFNAKLKTNQIKQLDKSDGIRYLCEDGTKTFRWDSKSLSASGSKRTYNLRLVNWVKMITK
ncbi:MAG: FimB/Mfa2 family fimbrial subunit [Bacteroidaceae bacterium]|nr:FimB/Mfa2 family fimbrial subunit [Bacteroidaceae bacterium]